MAEEMIMETEVVEVAENEKGSNAAVKITAAVVTLAALTAGGIAFAKTKGKELKEEHKAVKEFKKQRKEQMKLAAAAATLKESLDSEEDLEEVEE